MSHAKINDKDLPESVLRDVIRTKKASGWKIFNWFSSGKSKKPHPQPNPKEPEIQAKVSPKDSPTKRPSPDQKPQNANCLNKAKNIRFNNFLRFYWFFSRKSLKPNSQILKSFGLKVGKNTITYSITTEYQGTSILEAFIYLWPNTAKIVVSDIDGTITKFFAGLWS